MSTKKIAYTTLFNALAAALGYGGWAVYANYEHGIHAGLMAGCVQGVYAFFSTLSITQVARTAYVKHQGGLRGMLAGFSLSALVMLTIPLVVHHLAGTPDLLQTILPGLIWGSLYLIGFLISLDMKMRALPH